MLWDNVEDIIYDMLFHLLFSTIQNKKKKTYVIQLSISYFLKIFVPSFLIGHFLEEIVLVGKCSELNPNSSNNKNENNFPVLPSYAKTVLCETNLDLIN